VKTRFKAHIETHFPELLDNSFLLACSGGIDSMVLWQLCRDSGLHFEVAHCNFGLRGTESDEDAAFVREMGEKWNTKIHIKCFETARYGNLNKLSLQESARRLRYAWFRELLANSFHEHTVTAHQADDVLETFLINLIRGTGLEGLTGIPERAQNVRRPFLPFQRVEIEAYARSREIPWREDSSNTEEKYLRNRLRHSVVPHLKRADVRMFDNFQKTLGFLNGSNALVRNHITDIRREVFQNKGKIIRIPLEALARLDPLDTYLFELFRIYGFTDWKALNRLIEGVSGKEIRSSSHRLLRDRDALLLKSITPADSGTYAVYPKTEDTGLSFPLTINSVATLGVPGPNVLYVDSETLKEGLQLRKWKKGDYFYPLGMKGRQKVSKYFKDHKFNLFEKEDQWILCSGSEIVWLVGHRPDERFKIQAGTKQILKIEWIG
jgi:tRNA(Ile)-lysidine synthase